MIIISRDRTCNDREGTGFPPGACGNDEADGIPVEESWSQILVLDN